jgi:hypothetical protein
LLKLLDTSAQQFILKSPDEQVGRGPGHASGILSYD